VREACGWLFDPAEVAESKTARTASAPPPAAPLSVGRLAARVFYLFEDGEAERKKSAQEERRGTREERSGANWSGGPNTDLPHVGIQHRVGLAA